MRRFLLVLCVGFGVVLPTFALAIIARDYSVPEMRAKMDAMEMTYCLDDLRQHKFDCLHEFIGKHRRAREKGQALLQWILEEKLSDAVKAFVERGGPVNVRDSLGQTPLHVAAELGDEVLVELLIRKKAKINAVDNDGNSALLRAADFLEAPIVAVLLRAGADPNLANRDKQTPLHIAVRRRGLQTVTALLASKKIAINPRDKLGITPLMLAVQMSRWPLAIELRDAKGNMRDPKVVAGDDATSRVQPTAIIELLLARGANPETAARGDSAWNWAKWMNLPQISNILDPTAHVPDVSDAWLPVQLVAEGKVTCALMSDSTVVCWGLEMEAPSPLPGLVGASSISLGRDALCARRESDVKCFGGHAATSRTLVKSLKQIAIGANQAFIGLLANGDLFGSQTQPSSAAKSIQANGDLACALIDGGRVQCWSQGKVFLRTPRPVISVDRAESIAVSGDRGCAVLFDGSLSCWPLSTQQTGDLPLELTATAITSIGGVDQIALGYDRACARKADGTVACWGRNTLSQGDRSESPQIVPNLKAIDIAVGDEHACALTREHVIVCWGKADRLGRGADARQANSWFTVPQVVSF